MRGFIRGVAVLGLLTVALMAWTAPAQAITFNFNSDHCTGGCGTPPFGTVTVLQNGANVGVTVHLNPPNFFIKTGAGDGQAFLFNGTGVALGDIVVPAHVPALAAAAGPFGQGGVGTFGFGIGCPLCGNGAPDRFNTDILFTVNNATIADLTAPNAAGNIFVADIISCNVQSCGSGTGTGNTGLIDVTGAAVPEPTSLAFLGSGLILTALFGRRWKREDS